MLNVVAVSGRMVERKLSERGGRGKIEGSEIARISRIFGFYAFLGIDTSAMEERGFYTAVPSIDVQREREREREIPYRRKSLSPISFKDDLWLGRVETLLLAASTWASWFLSDGERVGRKDVNISVILISFVDE